MLLRLWDKWNKGELLGHMSNVVRIYLVWPNGLNGSRKDLRQNEIKKPLMLANIRGS